MTIDLTTIPFQPLTGVSFNWGARPATSAKVTIYNLTSSTPNISSTSTFETTVTFPMITISSAYNASTNDIIQAYTGNMTEFSFSEPIYSGQYITLTIAGCQAPGDEEGATVSEFNVFGLNGTVFGSSNSTTGNSTSSFTIGTVTPVATSGQVGAVVTAGLSAATTSGTAGAATQTASSGAYSLTETVHFGLFFFSMLILGLAGSCWIV